MKSLKDMTILELGDAYGEALKRRRAVHNHLIARLRDATEESEKKLICSLLYCHE